jgi:hypothetical protein
VNFFESLVNKTSNLKPSQIIEGAFLLKINEVGNLVLKQLDEGINSEGNIIGTYSNTYTQPLDHNNMAGYPKVKGDPFNLLDSGFFRNSIKVLVDEEGIRMYADGKTGKDEDIIKKYGKEIIGFTFDSVNKAIELIKQDVANGLRDSLLEIR